MLGITISTKGYEEKVELTVFSKHFGLGSDEPY